MKWKSPETVPYGKPIYGLFQIVPNSNVMAIYLIEVREKILKSPKPHSNPIKRFFGEKEWVPDDHLTEVYSYLIPGYKGFMNNLNVRHPKKLVGWVTQEELLETYIKTEEE